MLFVRKHDPLFFNIWYNAPGLVGLSNDGCI